MTMQNFIIWCRKCDIPLWACVYFLVAFPAAFLFPPWVGWENGPLEMVQNIVLAAGAACCSVLFCKARGPYRHGLWLAASVYFLILLGRELSWGRVFMLKTMTDHGPVFVSMHSLPHYILIHGIIAVIILMTLLALIVLMPWKEIFLHIPFPGPAFLILIAASAFAALGDKGLLTGGPFDENLEEEMELLVYILHLYFVRWYYHEMENTIDDKNRQKKQNRI